MEPTPLGVALTELLKVFTSVVGEVGDVLTTFTQSTALLFLLGLMFSGAIFSFAFRLIHRR